jgi:hypothetical protein
MRLRSKFVAILTRLCSIARGRDLEKGRGKVEHDYVTMKLSFSLTTKSKPVGTAPPLKAPSAFATADDDAIDAAPTASNSNQDVAPNKRLLAQNVGQGRTMKKRIEAEKRVDATVFEYDEVYDKMQEAKARQKVTKEVETKERKVCPLASATMTRTYNKRTSVAIAQIYTGPTHVSGNTEVGPPTCGGENDPT